MSSNNKQNALSELEELIVLYLIEKDVDPNCLNEINITEISDRFNIEPETAQSVMESLIDRQLIHEQKELGLVIGDRIIFSLEELAQAYHTGMFTLKGVLGIYIENLLVEGECVSISRQQISQDLKVRHRTLKKAIARIQKRYEGQIQIVNR